MPEFIENHHILAIFKVADDVAALRKFTSG
jgi:hypothetical protein